MRQLMIPLVLVSYSAISTSTDAQCIILRSPGTVYSAGRLADAAFFEAQARAAEMESREARAWVETKCMALRSVQSRLASPEGNEAELAGIRWPEMFDTQKCRADRDLVQRMLFKWTMEPRLSGVERRRFREALVRLYRSLPTSSSDTVNDCIEAGKFLHGLKTAVLGARATLD